MFITRIEFNELKKKVKEQEIMLERYKRSGCSKGIEEYIKNVLDEKVEYSRYAAIDILRILPETYVLGRSHNRWYCKDSTDSWSDVVYYKTAAEACANVYVKLLKERGRE
jgi:hypothetical protein